MMAQTERVLSSPLVISLVLSALMTMPVTEDLLLLRERTIWFLIVL